MIQKLKSLDSCMDFIMDVNRDPEFSDPMLVTDEQWRLNLLRSVERTDEDVLGVYRDGTLIGFFVFVVSAEDRNLEMTVGLSRCAEAYEEVLDYLPVNYPGYQADFVFNPKNYLLKELLEQKGADFDPEQQKMVFSGKAPEVNTEGLYRCQNSTWSSMLPCITLICTGRRKRWQRGRTVSMFSWQWTRAM